MERAEAGFLRCHCRSAKDAHKPGKHLGHSVRYTTTSRWGHIATVPQKHSMDTLQTGRLPPCAWLPSYSPLLAWLGGLQLPDPQLLGPAHHILLPGAKAAAQ